MSWKKELNFSKLVEQSNQLVSSIDAQNLLLSRPLEQTDKSTLHLLNKSQSVIAGDKARNKAHYLLAGTGFDADKLTRNLNAINLKTTFEPLEPISDTDIDAYLRHEHELMILTALEESKKETVLRLEEKIVRSREQDWENSKRELLEGEFRGHRKFAQPKERLQLIAPQPHAPNGHKTAMDNKMLKYAKVVTKLNTERASSNKFPLISAFTNTAEQLDTRKSEIIVCWNILKSILDEQFINGRTNLSEGCYIQAYLNNSSKLQSLFIRGAKRHLEQQYLNIIEEKTRMNPSIARVGPIPSLRNVIRGYLNIKHNIDPNNPKWQAELELDTDRFPIWGQIFYALRCGDIQTALEIASSSHPLDTKTLGHFPVYLKEYEISMKTEEGEPRLKEGRWEEIINEYKVISSRGNADPYKLALYNIIGRCDVSKTMAMVFTTTQDFMWFKLSLILEPKPQEKSPKFSNFYYPLSSLQKLLVEYGAEHFRNPMLYFEVLLLSQQFERALIYLTSVEQCYVDAVHYAIALYYYGTLRQPSSPQMLDPRTPILDIVRLLQQYVGIFATTDAVEALQYLLLLRDDELVERTGISRKDQSIKDLLLDTREYDAIIKNLGDSSGRIIDLAASACEQSGKDEDAIQLYYRIGNYDKVLEILNKKLGMVLTVRTPERVRVITLSAEYFKSLGGLQNANSKLFSTFQILLTLTEFFDLYYNKRYYEALNLLDSTGLIPAATDRATMEARDKIFNDLDLAVQQNFGAILLATMDIYSRLYTELKASVSSPLARGRDDVRDLKMQELKNRARILVMFAGMLKFRLPGDTAAQLVRMEVFML